MLKVNQESFNENDS